jgi:hypothetical protein
MNHNTNWFTLESIAEKITENRNRNVIYLNGYTVVFVWVLHLQYQH